MRETRNLPRGSSLVGKPKSLIQGSSETRADQRAKAVDPLIPPHSGDERGPKERAGFMEAPVIGPPHRASRATVPPIARAASCPTALVSVATEVMTNIVPSAEEGGTSPDLRVRVIANAPWSILDPGQELTRGAGLLSNSRHGPFRRGGAAGPICPNPPSRLSIGSAASDSGSLRPGQFLTPVKN